MHYIKYPFNHLILYMGDFVWHIECIDAKLDSLGNNRIWFFMNSESQWNYLTLPSGIMSTSFPPQLSMGNFQNSYILRTKLAQQWPQSWLKALEDVMWKEFCLVIVAQIMVTHKSWKIKICFSPKNEALHQCTQYVKQNPPYRGLSG